MLKVLLVIFIVGGCGVRSQTVFPPGTNVPNVCVCGTAGQCAVAGGGAPTDGSESSAFEARIMNPGAAPSPTNVTSNMTCSPISTGLPLAADSQDDCANGLDRCCPPTVGYTCGLRYPSVMNAQVPTGSQVSYGDFSFQVALFSSNDVYLGTGALIDHLHVLTAAHRIANVSSTDLKVRLGDWNLFATNEPFPAVTISASFMIHPNFTRANLKNNIAIVTLSQPAPLGKYPTISNICLPNTTISGMRCAVSGWGKVDNTTTAQNVLSAVDLPLVDPATCQTQLRKTALGPRFALDRACFMCAGGEAGKDACNGDGGAPLSCFIGGRYYLVGLAAWGVGCGVADVPGVYVNIQTYIPWIQDVISKQSNGTSSLAANAAQSTTAQMGKTQVTTTQAASNATTPASATTVKAAVTTTTLRTTVKAAGIITSSRPTTKKS